MPWQGKTANSNRHLTSLKVLKEKEDLKKFKKSKWGRKKGFFKKLINRGSHISKVLNINTIEGGLNKYVTGEHFSGKS